MVYGTVTSWPSVCCPARQPNRDRAPFRTLNVSLMCCSDSRDGSVGRYVQETLLEIGTLNERDLDTSGRVSG